MASQEEYLRFIKENPGTTQAEVCKKLGACNYPIVQLLKKKLIRRETDKKGRTFRLYPNSTEKLI